MSSVLNILLSNPESFFSGEAIAQSLSMTRANVWKEIKKLRQEGIEIESIPNRGYRFVSAHHVLVPQLMQSPQHTFNPIYCLDSIDSTNLEAKRQAAHHDHDFLIVANQQTQGKGRKGRHFYSPKNAGIYASFVLHPNFDSKYIQLLTLAAAVSVCETIESLYQIKATIKWQNDIYINHKKVCGILTEGEFELELQRFAYVVVGMGINMQYDPSTAAELSPIYTALSEHTDMPLSRNRLIQKLSERLKYWVDAIPERQSDLVSEYRKRNCILMQELTIADEDHTVYRALDIDDFGQLIIENIETHQQRILNANEISIGAISNDPHNT